MGKKIKLENFYLKFSRVKNKKELNFQTLSSKNAKHVLSDFVKMYDCINSFYFK